MTASKSYSDNKWTSVTPLPKDLGEIINLDDFRSGIQKDTPTYTGQESSPAASSEENVIIAKDFDMKLEMPVYIKKGEKVTIKIAREMVGTTESYNIDNKSNFLKRQSDETNSIKLKQLEQENEQLLKTVEVLEERLKHFNAIINNNLPENTVLQGHSSNNDELNKYTHPKETTHTEKEEEVIMADIHKMSNWIERILNVSSFLFFSVAFVFLLMSVFNIVIPRTDSVFVAFLLCLFGTMFYLDKFYRRLLNR